MEVYLDNAATTKVSENVAEVMKRTMLDTYGNPSSRHRKGIEAEVSLKFARDVIAKSLKVSPKEIIFTSGGTESNNLALIGAAYANRRSGNCILTTAFEHSSVYNPLMHLKEEGFDIRLIPVDENGQVDEDVLVSMIDDTVFMVSIMYVNNEIGAVQDIRRLSKAVKKIKHDVIFHTDAIQAYGKYMMKPKHEGIDLLSVSAHKIHGPKGIGFLYIDEKVRIKPVFFGGGQQSGLRSGTENIPAIIGMSEAVKEAYEGFADKINHLYQIKTLFTKGLQEIEDVYVHAIYADCSDSSLEDRIRRTAPHIVNAGFAGIKSEVLLNSLDNKGVCVSSGSACAVNHKELSSTLQAIGVKNEIADSSIRFSFHYHTTEDEIVYTLEQLKESIELLRKYKKK